MITRLQRSSERSSTDPRALRTRRTPIGNDDQLIGDPPTDPPPAPPQNDKYALLFDDNYTYDDDTMSIEGSTSISVVRLQSQQDWSVQIDHIKTEARELRIWSNINYKTPEPDKDNPVQFKALPAYSVASLTIREQISDAQFTYKCNRDTWNNKQKGYQRIKTIIDQSISQDLKHRVLNCQTIRAKLKRLAEFIKPNTLAAAQLLKKELKSLTVTPYSRSISDYMQLWFMQYSKKDALGAQTDNESTQAQLTSMTLLYSNYIATRTSKLLDKQETGTVTALYLELTVQEAYFQHNRETKFRGKVYKASVARTAIATALGKASSNKLKLLCLCSKLHRYRVCFYLNLDFLRPNNWKPRKDIKDRIKKRFREDKGLKERVDKII